MNHYVTPAQPIPIATVLPSTSLDPTHQSAGAQQPNAQQYVHKLADSAQMQAKSERFDAFCRELVSAQIVFFGILLK